MRVDRSAAGEPRDRIGANAALELLDVTAGYGRSTVLREVSLTLGQGAVGALLGPNGAGKTTLLRTAAGLMRSSSGRITIDGLDHTRTTPHDRARAGVCLIPEGRGIFRSLTVKENLRLQVPPWINESGLDRALDAFPILRDRLHERAGRLSGGQQQMLAVARCYLAEPKVVLIDEVSMGLAPQIVDQLFASLMRLVERGTSVLLVEQYVNRALEMADTVYLLSQGRLTYSGPPSALDADTVLEGYLGFEADRASHRSAVPLAVPRRHQTIDLDGRQP
jgi:branched-chain amino acid transport system ATP-binding protein